MLVFSLFCLSLFLLQRVWETEPLLVRDCKSQFLSSPGNVSRPLVFAAFGRKLESGYLHHVFSILKQYGFEQGSISSMEWDLLWQQITLLKLLNVFKMKPNSSTINRSHEYPFRVMKDQLMKLKQHQKVCQINLKNILQTSIYTFFRQLNGYIHHYDLISFLQVNHFPG